MINKFDNELKTKYAEYLLLIKDIVHLTDDLDKLITKNLKKNAFLKTTIQFAKIAVETPSCIIQNLKIGYLSHVFILLRWYLEMNHLCLYLWKNPDEYRAWQNGKQIRPKNIGKYIKGIGFHPCKEIYQEWSNVIHGNSSFIDNYHVLANMSPKNENAIVLIGNALMNTIWVSQKYNYLLGKIIQPHLRNEYENIVLRYNRLDERIDNLIQEQNQLENKIMKNN